MRWRGSSGNSDEVVQERACVVGVEPVVAACASAELACSEARVADEQAVMEDRAAGVAEAGAAAGAESFALSASFSTCEEMFWPTAVVKRRVRSATEVGFCGPSLGFSKNTP